MQIRDDFLPEHWATCGLVTSLVNDFKLFPKKAIVQNSFKTFFFLASWQDATFDKIVIIKNE